LVDIQNGHTYGWICPCCVSCLSKEYADVKNDDVTSGSMSPGRKRHKNTTLGGKELTLSLLEVANVKIQDKSQFSVFQLSNIPHISIV